MLPILSRKKGFMNSLIYLGVLSWLPFTLTSSLECRRFDENRRILLNPRASVSFGKEYCMNFGGPCVIGVLLPLSTLNKDGSCSPAGPLTGYGVLAYETLRWGLERINKNFGQIGRRIVHKSFIPGLEIGLQLYDTCGEREQSLLAIETLFTDIRKEPQSCSHVEVPLTSPVPLGILDLTGNFNKMDELKQVMENKKIPLVSSDFMEFDSTDDRAEAVLTSVSKMGWRRIALIADQQLSSVALVQRIELRANSHNSCVTQIAKLEGFQIQLDDVMEDPLFQKLKEMDLDSDVIVVITSEERNIQRVLRIIEHLPRSKDVPSAAMVFAKSFSEQAMNTFRKTLTGSFATVVKNQTQRNLFQISFSPSSVSEFVFRWKDYQINNFYETDETQLITSYLEQVKNCTRNPSSSSTDISWRRPCVSMKLSREQELLPTAASAPFFATLHGFLTFVNAFKNAWKAKCQSRQGLCKEVGEMNREEFRDSFLNPLHFTHSDPGNRSPQELKGRKDHEDFPGTLRGMNYGFFKVEFGRKNVLLATEVFKISGTTAVVKSQRIFEGFRNSKPRNITKENCVSRNGSEGLFQKQDPLRRGKTTQESRDATKNLIFIPSSSEIYVVGLFPVHFTSENRTDCSSLVDPEALQEVEAFLWAIDQINLHQKLLPNTELGVLVLDTCGSKIRATNQVTNIMKNSLREVNISISQILTFITSLDVETAGVTGNLLQSMNITSISLGRSEIHSPFALQMEPPVNEEAEAMIQILSFLGWTFVSVIVSHSDFEARLGANAFKTIAEASGICIAREIKIVSMTADAEGIKTQIKELIKASNDGARGVVTFLTEKHLKLLLKSLKNGTEEGFYENGQLSFLGATTWGDNLGKLRSFDGVSNGILVLRDGQKDVEEFTLNYRLLTPLNATRNPWFKEFWLQHFDCIDYPCTNRTSSAPPPVVPYFSTPSTPRVIQAVFSFGAALTQMLDHLCPHAMGKMCPGLPRWRQRVVLNEFLRNTEVSRVDEPLEYFQFSENFHGNAPLEIFNLRHKAKESSSQVNQVGRYVDSTLTMSKQLFQGFSNGSETPYKLLESTCVANCHLCDVRGTDYVFIESPQKIYLMAAFDIHEKGPKPLECGLLRSDQGIQNTEALLWSMRKLNENSTVKIGAIIFDSCHSKERIVGEVTNFLTGRIPDFLKEKIPSPRHIIGVITGSRGDVMRQLLDVTQPYHLTTVATQARQSFLENVDQYPYLLTLSPPNSAIANSLIALVEFWNWELISVVYSDFGDSQDVFRHFLRKTDSLPNLKLSVVQDIPSNVSDVNFMIDVWSRLAKGAQEGSRVIFLFLETPHELFFLQTASKLHEEGLIKPGDFVYIMTKSPRAFIKNETEALGSIILQPINGFLREFASYFEGLSLANHQKPYKWFRKFWSKIIDCKGASCSDLKENAIGNHYIYRQTKGVVETSNAVLLLQTAWTKMQQNVCGESATDVCIDAILNSDFKQNFYEVVRSLRFNGVDGGLVRFTPGGVNAAATLQILNYRKSIGGQSAFVRVGTYNGMNGLSLNSSLVFTYDENMTPIPLLKIQSKCIDFVACGNLNNKKVIIKDAENKTTPDKSTNAALKTDDPGFQQVYPFQRFGISILVPLHGQGQDFFSCGTFSSEAIFQNLVAIVYALSKINSNEVGLGLGAVIFDFCSRIEKAREQYFSFFSGQMQQSQNISMTHDRIVASISFDDNAAEAVSSILSSNYIPHFSFPVVNSKLRDRQDATILSSIPSRSAEIRLFINILEAFRWKYVSVIYDNDLTGTVLLEMFRTFSRKNDVCIADSLTVPKRLSKEYANEIVETLSLSWKPTVIILLMDDSDNIRTILEVFTEMKMSEKFTFLSGAAWGNKMVVTKGLERISAGALTITLETYDLPDFRNFLSNLTLDNHKPISNEWYEEYFQNKYQCKLSKSRNQAKQFEKECSRTETTHPDSIIQDPLVFHTILGVNSVAHGLDSYIRKQCSNAKTVDECKVIQAELLLEILEQGQLHLNSTKNVGTHKRPGSYGYHIWNFRKLGKEYGYVNIGQYKNGKIQLEKSNIEFKIGTWVPKSFCIEGKCLEVCSFQSPIYAVLSIPEPLAIDHNFKSVYGIVASSLSLLGILVILVILVYFMMTFPSAEGSSILGYFILIGCLMIYSVNFAFIFQPTIGTCSLRRFLMGLAYAIVFSAMLIKVVHSWRKANYFEEDERSASHLCMLILVCVALIMVEIILASAWLILYPPKVDLMGEMWRCAPSESFETELVISLVYVMILIAATLVFCNETWQCRDTVKQTRWILLAGSTTAFTWLIWTVVATQAPIHFRDPAIVIGNLVSASAILMFLYARRFYIYSYLREDLKDLEMRSQFSAGFGKPVLSRTRSLEHEFTKNTINPLSEYMPGTHYVGDQDVSFRTVTLPPERPVLRRSSTRTSRVSRSSRASRPVFELSVEDDLPTDLNFNALYESSEEDFATNVIPRPADDDMDSVTAIWGDGDVSSEKERALPTTILTGRRTAVQRTGSKQMLVFLTDGSTMGEVSRI